jgi:site-specific DNA-methyltransferase (adenine-specific)
MKVSNYTLYHGDCLEEMKNIPNNSIDCVICDLPYGMTKNSWDIIIPFNEMWDRLNYVCKPTTPILLFGNQPFSSHLVLSNEKDFRYSLVWVKNKFSDFLNAKRKPMKTNEDILVFYKKQPTFNPQFSYGEPYKRWNTQTAVDKQSNYGGHKQNISQSDGKRLPTTVLHFNRIERPQHPTQKPVDLLEYLIKTYTNEGDTVLDFTMGSGSTGVACMNTNRKFIGVEKEENYFQIAEERIKEASNNLNNFME